MPSVDQLPDDPMLLKRMIAERDVVIARHESAIMHHESVLELCDRNIEGIKQESAAALAQRDARIAQREADIAQRDAQLAARSADIEQIKREAAERIEAEIARHKMEMDALLRRFYGPRSERFDPTQLLLFGLMMAERMPVNAGTVLAESGEKLSTRRINHHKHGRRALPANLPRRQVLHDLPESEKPCPCCGKMRICIGQEVSEQLEYIPSMLEVIQNIRPKYACEDCGDGSCPTCDGSPHIQIAPPAEQPIQKGLPGPGLVAYVITSKLADHLPLYRLENIFDRHGVEIARSTMCSWMLAAGDLVRPLVELIGKRIGESKVIHTDDTRVPVQDGSVKGACKSGRIWTKIGDDRNPFIEYVYTPDRTRAGPQAFLKGFKGYLQADAYGGYDGIYAGGFVIEVACWAHGRRKFFDAKETDQRRSAQMLELARRLYAVEDEARVKVAQLLKRKAEASLDEQYEVVRALRQEKSMPILAQIKTWLEKQKLLVLPRSPMAGAIGYMLNQWAALNRYAGQGYLNIDNNAAERALKRIAIGRKNWLFAGNDEAGASHARLYTLIASAERHGLNPQAYLRSILAKIGQTPLSELDQFLPDVWKRESQPSPATPSTPTPPLPAKA